MRELDRDSVVPLYFQLAAALLERLETGAWPPGARFATERELEEVFGVSRAVIRRSLGLLVGDGVIVRVKGSGAFVAEPRRKVPVFGLVKALSGPPADVSLTVLTVREQAADTAMAHFLEMDQRFTGIVHVTAVLHVAGRPIGLIDSRVSAALVPWVLPFAEALRTKTEPPEPGQVDLGRATLLLEHTFFGQWGGPTVGVAAGAPALMGRYVQYGRVGKAKRERPLEFARLIYRSDSAQVTVDLTEQGPS